MTVGIGTIASALVVLVGASLLAALMIAALFPMVQRRLQRHPPATRASLLLALACAPAAAGLVMLILSLSPSLIHMLGLGTDHCQDHGHHAHFCLIHTPLLAGTDVERLILFAAAFAVLTLGARLTIRLNRVRRLFQALRATQIQKAAQKTYRVVDTPVAFAVTTGLLRQAIYLSSGLLSRLSSAELAVVVDHEQTHCQRRDALRLFVADILSRLHLPAVRRRLIADLHLASERACDEQAALAAGDRLRVAETILKVVRLTAEKDRSFDALLPSVTGSDVQARVLALLDPAPTAKGWPCLAALLGAGLLCGIGLIYADGLHHAVESALHHLID